MEFNPETGETVCLVDGLYFANGVDISPDGAYLIFAETFTGKVFKLFLSGPQVRLDVILHLLVWLSACNLCNPD